MTEEIQRAFEFIQVIADRAVQRGNIFVNMNEAMHFQNCLNQIIGMVNSYERSKTNGG